MEVYALIGTSGTGKSSSAITLAYDKQIEAIIDDGLLIYKGKTVAGKSAKFEKTMIAAVKRAIFLDEQDAKDAREQIKELEMERILLIGTSKKMVDRIAERLQLGPIHEYVPIEDILTKEEIEQAQHERMTKGTHIIPVSYKLLDQGLFQKIMQKGIDVFSPHREKIGETTIVRPYFHLRLLAKLREQSAKHKERKKQRRLEKEKKAIYQSQRRYLYMESMKAQYAKLIPELMNYLNYYLEQVKQMVSKYVHLTKYYLYEALITMIAYLYHLLAYLVGRYDRLLAQ